MPRLWNLRWRRSKNNQRSSSFVESMITHKKTFQMKIYQGTQHAFFNETRPSYNKEAAEDAWTMTLAFFNKYLKATHMSNENQNQNGSSLLWDCFTNWSLTTRKNHKTKKTRKNSEKRILTPNASENRKLMLPEKLMFFEVK